MDEQEKRWTEQIRQLEDSFCNPRKLKEAEELREELKSRGYIKKSTEMIDHTLIPTKYKGWVRIDRPDAKVLEKFFPGCVQYWHEDLKQSLFFDRDKTNDNLMSTGTSDGKMYRTLLLGTWEDFEECCQRCGIKLEAV